MSTLTSQKELPPAHPQSWHVVALRWSSQMATGWFNIIQIQKMDEPSKRGRFDSHVILCYEWAWSTFFCNNGSSRYILNICIYIGLYKRSTFVFLTINHYNSLYTCDVVITLQQLNRHKQLNSGFRLEPNSPAERKNNIFYRKPHYAAWRHRKSHVFLSS